MDILLNNFPYGCVNIYVENSTPLKRDEKLISWFLKEYDFLRDMDNIDFLVENTDFGVGD